MPCVSGLASGLPVRAGDEESGPADALGLAAEGGAAAPPVRADRLAFHAAAAITSRFAAITGGARMRKPYATHIRAPTIWVRTSDSGRARK
jgi:hypothetical protein